MSGPVALVLRFAGPPVSPTPAQVHAAFLGMIRRGDPALAAALHHPKLGLRPYTLAVVGNPQTGKLGLRLAVLDPEVFHRFWSRWNRRGGLPLTLGRRRLVPAAVDGDGPWTGSAEWGDLACRGGGPAVRFTWCTPTSFRQGDVDLPLPVPRLVFGGLLEKWNRFSSSPLVLEPQVVDRWVVLAGARLCTKVFSDGRSATPGFVGWTEFRVLRSAPEEVGAAVLALARYAFFAGVGRKTTHGMGLVRTVL